MRADAIRAEAHPNHPPSTVPALRAEHGRTATESTIGHLENIAFDPEGESADFYVISGRVRLFGTFDAVSSVAIATGAHFALPCAAERTRPAPAVFVTIKA